MFFKLILFLCVVLLACKSCTMCARVPGALVSEEGGRTPETRVIDSCELPRGCRELKLGPLQEQHTFLTTELFLQAPGSLFDMDKFITGTVWEEKARL